MAFEYYRHESYSITDDSNDCYWLDFNINTIYHRSRLFALSYTEIHISLKSIMIL